MHATDEPGRTRRRSERAARPTRVGRSTDGYRDIRNTFEHQRSLSDDEVEHLHDTALRYLERAGVRVLLPEARRLFAGAGARVDDDDQMVRLDAALTAQLLTTAPASFTIHARNPKHSMHIGGDGLVLVPVAGPPYVSDRLRGRRTGTFADFQDFIRLAQHCDVMHGSAPSVEPQDLPLEQRQLTTTHATLTLTDKVPFVYSRGRHVVADSFEQIRIANGVAPEEFQKRAYCWTNINTNSPRQLDVPMSLGIIDAARAGQATVMTPFTLAGAMAPVSLAGALLLQHIEAIAAIALSQIVRPGAPVVYGAFTSNVDMRSGAPAFGTPETLRAALASGQLARRLGVPWRSQAASASPTEDAQAATESMVSMAGCLLGGANLVIHAAGWQEGGLVASFEKFVLDVEMLQIMTESLRPIRVDDAELAIDALDDVGPGGHFFGTQHTLDRYSTAFYEPVVFTRQNFGQWTDAGAPDAATRATGTWQRWLSEYRVPDMSDTIRAELDDHLARRCAEGGALPES